MFLQSFFIVFIEIQAETEYSRDEGFERCCHVTHCVGGDGCRDAVAVCRVTVCLCGRVDSQGVFRYSALSRVVLRGKAVRCGELSWNTILWGRRKLRWSVGLSHRIHRIGRLLVTLKKKKK